MVEYRLATAADIPALARLRSVDWGDIDYWTARITAYLDGSHTPRQGLALRVSYVAAESGEVVGFVAGHLTRRYGCDGEVQWLNVAPERRRCGIASGLLRQLAAWFAQQGAKRICVDVDPDNAAGRALYTRLGAEPLNPHWLVWPNIQGLTPKDALSDRG